jgi:hypothetical protein
LRCDEKSEKEGEFFIAVAIELTKPISMHSGVIALLRKHQRSWHRQPQERRIPVFAILDIASR